MPITQQQKTKILQVVNVFETGTIEGDYANISIYADGPTVNGAKVKQITYGRSQTTEFGNLKALLQQYVATPGALYAATIQPYINSVGKHPSLHTNAAFKKALKDAGKLDPIMLTVQDSFFDQLYYQPAITWFTGMKFTTALSLLVIYDSFIHSGGILSFLRERFTEEVPKNGGDEKKWIKQYVNVRHEWLANHSNTILRNTIYRTECFKDAIAKSNWDLVKTLKANGTDVPK